MNKQEFLEDLNQRIAMLEDSEQQDILAEYAQHIDLRISGGLSEEEAIRDFGDPDQLAREILGAYHVKPDFRNTAQAPAPTPAAAQGVRGMCSTLGQKLSGAGRAVRDFFVRMGHGIGTWFRGVSSKVRGWFHRDTGVSVREPRPPKVKKERGPWLAGLRSGWNRTISWLGSACILLLRLAWNLALLLCASPIILLALAIMLGLGALVILLCQGYPLVGVTLCTLGVLLCCAALLGLGWTLIWHRPGKENFTYDQAE